MPPVFASLIAGASAQANLELLRQSASHDSYGLCRDSQGNVWNSSLVGDQIRKFGRDGIIVVEEIRLAGIRHE